MSKWKKCEHENCGYLSISPGQMRSPIDLSLAASREIVETLGDSLVEFSLSLDDQPRYQPLVRFSYDWRKNRQKKIKNQSSDYLIATN